MKTLPVAAVLAIASLVAGCSHQSTDERPQVEAQPAPAAEPQATGSKQPQPGPKQDLAAAAPAAKFTTTTGSKITKENFEKLKGNLSRADVFVILGEPDGIEPVGRIEGSERKASVWHGEGFKILVLFNTNGEFWLTRMDQEKIEPGTHRIYGEFGNEVSYARNDVRMIGSPPSYGYANVSGSGVLKNDKDQVVAEGDLQVVEGFIGLRAKRGATFFYVPSQEQCSSPRWRENAPPPVASLRYGKDHRWEVMDTNFFFLMEDLTLDTAASIARQSTIQLHVGSFKMFGYNIHATKNGATAKFSYGKVVGTVECTATEDKAAKQ